MVTKLRTDQVANAAGVSLETLLTNLATTGTPASNIKLPDGTIIKVGTIAATAQIGSGASATITVAFAEAFPNSCDFFDALLTPGTSTDFYGITGLVSKTKTQVQFTVRNGATAQIVSGGCFLAVGR